MREESWVGWGKGSSDGLLDSGVGTDGYTTGVGIYYFDYANDLGDCHISLHT